MPEKSILQQLQLGLNHLVVLLVDVVRVAVEEPCLLLL
jgi:hypothetical protein